MVIRDALNTIIKECRDESAKVYARAALRDEMSGKELCVQIRYILCNLQYWRGDKAREVKKALNFIIRDKKGD